jgi:hypothetical protein
MEQEYKNYNKYEDETNTYTDNDNTTHIDDVDQQYKDANLPPEGEDIDTIDDNYKEWEDNKKEIQKEFSSYDEYEKGSYYDNKSEDEQQTNRYKYDNTSTKSTKYNQKKSNDNWDNDLTQHKTSTQSTSDYFTQQKEMSYAQKISPIMPINSATNNMSMNKNPFEQSFKRDDMSYAPKFDYWGSDSNQSNTTPKVSDYQKQQIQQAKSIEQDNAQRQKTKLFKEKQLYQAQVQEEKRKIQEQQKIDKELEASMRKSKDNWLNDNTNNRGQNVIDYFTDKYVNDNNSASKKSNRLYTSGDYSANYKPQNVSQNTQISNQPTIQRDYIPIQEYKVQLGYNPYTLNNVINVVQQQTITNKLDKIKDSNMSKMPEEEGLIDPIGYLLFGKSIPKLPQATKLTKTIYEDAKNNKEYEIGEYKIAPFGNKYKDNKSNYGRFPHYHVPRYNEKGNIGRGQGKGRHRPWENFEEDKSFWDKF